MRLKKVESWVSSGKTACSALYSCQKTNDPENSLPEAVWASQPLSLASNQAYGLLDGGGEWLNSA